MKYPPYCVLCGSKANWNSDFDCEDYGFDVEGVVGVYTCCNCQISQYIIDVFSEDEEMRIIKYEKADIDELSEEDCINLLESDDTINNCFNCSHVLEEVSSKAIDVSDVLTHDSPIEPCVSTELYCSKCNIYYNVVDITSNNELYPDEADYIFFNRSIYVK